MFPFDVMTPAAPALLSPISFNVALQQLFNSVSLLLAHQHALVLNLSVSHTPDPTHPIPTQSKSQSQSQSYFRSYADALKSSTPSIHTSAPRSSFTIRQITPIEKIVLSPKKSRSRSTTPRCPNSSRTPASEPEPQPQSQSQYQPQLQSQCEPELELVPCIPVDVPLSAPVTTTVSTLLTPAPALVLPQSQLLLLLPPAFPMLTPIR